MKTNYLLVILLITLIGAHCKTIAQIDKEQAIGKVMANLTNEELQNCNVLVFPNLIESRDFYLSPFHVLHSGYGISWLFFIDMFPKAQWDHDCKYIFLDQQTGNFTTINYRVPPQDYWYGWEYFTQKEEFLFHWLQFQENLFKPGMFMFKTKAITHEVWTL
jgi:hypothetical protein